MIQLHSIRVLEDVPGHPPVVVECRFKDTEDHTYDKAFSMGHDIWTQKLDQRLSNAITAMLMFGTPDSTVEKKT